VFYSDVSTMTTLPTADDEPDKLEAAVSTLPGVLRTLQNLFHTADGRKLYEQVELGSDICSGFTQTVERAFLSFLDTQLQRYIQVADVDPATRMMARLVQRRIAPFLAEVQDDRSLLVFDATVDQADSLQSDLETLRLYLISEMGGESVTVNAVAGPDPAIQSHADAGKRASVRLRPNLSKQRGKVEALQEKLDQRLTNTRHRNQDFLSNLKTVKVALETSGNDESVEDLRQVLLEGIEEMVAWQSELGSEINGACETLKAIRAGNIRLHEDIIRVRKLTQLDEFTGLPNRVAFSKRVESEIQRVLRIDSPMSIALINIDGLADILAGQGQDIVDVITYAYVEEVLLRFRGSDLAARLSDMDFALLLPDTHLLGAEQALIEAQRRAVCSPFSRGVSNHNSALPTFSAGIASFQRDDTATALLERASSHLQAALKKGRGTLIKSLKSD